MWLSEEASSKTGQLAKTSKKEASLWGLPGLEKASTRARGEKFGRSRAAGAQQAGDSHPGARERDLDWV